MHSSGQLADRRCVPGEENGSKTHHYMMLKGCSSNIQCT
jgi:hypothetical protein